MAGCRIGFERDIIQLHHVLATKLDDKGGNDLPLRPWWDA
jgi:cyclopropane-fatty-acyl-phospholipid synthase